MPAAQRKREVTEEGRGDIVLCKTKQICFVAFEVWFCGLSDGSGDIAFVSAITRNLVL